MSTAIEIFSRVSDYIEREITLRDLESWLVYMLPVYLSKPDSAASELASMIELGLAEINAGIRSEQGLRRLLTQHIAANSIKSESYPHQSSTSDTISSASTVLVWLSSPIC
jgi:hypothetical protein